MTSLLIDNYDSFTWNLYEYLSILGAQLAVHRNDKITLEEAIKLNPERIIISPGPSHPRNAGVSNEIIRHFAGKVPILGVCLGEQAMFEVFGGVVKHAGEIVHGKTSPIQHDGCGLFHGLPQGFRATRYHSLAGDLKTLPGCLKVTSTTPSGIIMGVRHVEFTVEGVQFHPESIASEEGKKLLGNFLRFNGGNWSYCSELLQPSIDSSSSEKLTILESIVERRKKDVILAANTPGQREEDLLKYLELGLAPKVHSNIFGRIKAAFPKTAVFAEIKRASPSKGIISASVNAAEQALKYADANVCAISVLTEPHWFKGSLVDLQMARQALEYHNDRPLVLRKDFLFCKYQILEARVFGADLVLLIVATVNKLEDLKSLMKITRDLKMEPLVEVNNLDEMNIAIEAGASLIGVNNRNLHTFTVDRETTARLSDVVAKANETREVLLIALSGIQSRADVEYYEEVGAKGVLVGESLMRSADPQAFIKTIQN